MDAQRINQEFAGPGFNELRTYLKSAPQNSPEALAALDIAEKYEIGAVMYAGGGIASRLMADRHVPGEWRGRTSDMFDAENRNRQTANEITDRIEQRRANDPRYAATVDYLITNVIRGIDRASEDAASVKMSRISRGIKAVVAEVCSKPTVRNTVVNKLFL